MKRLFLAVLLSVFAVGSAMAQETCESKAIGKNGKPLAGAAKTSFMHKCQRDTCAVKAVDEQRQEIAGCRQDELHEEM